VIQGCYTNASPHVLRVIDTAKVSKCPAGTTALSWGQTGPPGVPGPQATLPPGTLYGYQKLEGGDLTGLSTAFIVTCPATKQVISATAYLNLPGGDLYLPVTPQIQLHSSLVDIEIPMEYNSRLTERDVPSPSSYEYTVVCANVSP
jgi:hypothetical protein